MKQVLIVSALLFAVMAACLYQLTPRYPDGHENVTLWRRLKGAGLQAFFRVATWAEQLGIIADSADPIQAFAFKQIYSAAIVPNDITIENSLVAGVPVVIFRPHASPSHSRAVVYFHGGGFVLGSAMSHFPWTLRLVQSTDVVLISVDYRLAPKHPFPAAIEDSIRVTKAVFETADKLGIDKNRIAVAGDSAGGNLAAVVAIELASSEEYKLKAQVLISPVLVAAGVSTLPSYAHYHTIFRIKLDWFIVKYAGVRYTRAVEKAISSEHHVSVEDLNKIRHRLNISSLSEELLELIPDVKYANTRQSGANEEEMKTRPSEVEAIGRLALNQRAWPLIFEDDEHLKKVAPVLVQVCAFDPVRDEGLLYFNRLRSLGVNAHLSFLPNAIHVEPLLPDVIGAPHSTATVKGANDVIKFINQML